VLLLLLLPLSTGMQQHLGVRTLLTHTCQTNEHKNLASRNNESVILPIHDSGITPCIPIFEYLHLNGQMQKKRCKQRKSKNRFRNTVNHFQN
jgi:hypothetical protein